MKSYIENELKRNKIKKKYCKIEINTTKESNRGPIHWQATAVPVSQLWDGFKALI